MRAKRKARSDTSLASRKSRAGAGGTKKGKQLRQSSSAQCVDNVISWQEVSTPGHPPISRRRRGAESATYHTEQEWKNLRSEIESLYLEHDLEGLASIMAAKYGFEARPSQYKAKLSKWGVGKYLKLSVKQVLYIIRETIRRSNSSPGSCAATAFRLHGKRLNSYNLQRILRRRMEDENFKASSLVSALSSCGLSAYTPSTVGIKIPRYKAPKESEQKERDFVLRMEGNDCLISGNPGRGDLMFVKYPLRDDHLYMLPGILLPRLFDLSFNLLSTTESSDAPLAIPLYSSWGSENESLVRKVTFPSLRKDMLPDEIRFILYFLHLSYPDGNGPRRFTATFDSATESEDEGAQFRYTIECCGCSYTHIYDFSSTTSATNYFKVFNEFPKKLNDFADDFFSGHQNFIDNETIVDELSEHYGIDFGIAWQRIPSELLLRTRVGSDSDLSVSADIIDDWTAELSVVDCDPNIEHGESDRMSLSDIFTSDLWDEDDRQ